MYDQDVRRVPFRHPEGVGQLVEVVDLAELRVRTREMNHSIDRPTQLNFHLLKCVSRGEGAHWVDYRRVPLRSGELLHVRPGQVHAFDGDSTHDALLLVFLPEAIPQTLSLRLVHPLRPAAIRPSESEAKHILRLSGLMLAAQQEGNALGDQGALRHMLAAVLGAAQTVAGRQGPLAQGRASDASHAFNTLIDVHLYERRGLSWYARQLEVSTRTLSRACIKAFGMSAKQHLDGRVAVEAKRLLVHTDDSVQAVGARLGFEEATNFVKFFRRVEGETPHGFRRRIGTVGR